MKLSVYPACNIPLRKQVTPEILGWNDLHSTQRNDLLACIQQTNLALREFHQQNNRIYRLFSEPGEGNRFVFFSDTSIIDYEHCLKRVVCPVITVTSKPFIYSKIPYNHSEHQIEARSWIHRLPKNDYAVLMAVAYREGVLLYKNTIDIPEQEVLPALSWRFVKFSDFKKSEFIHLQNCIEEAQRETQKMGYQLFVRDISMDDEAVHLDNLDLDTYTRIVQNGIEATFQKPDCKVWIHEAENPNRARRALIAIQSDSSVFLHCIWEDNILRPFK